MFVVALTKCLGARICIFTYHLNRVVSIFIGITSYYMFSVELFLFARVRFCHYVAFFSLFGYLVFLLMIVTSDFQLCESMS